MKRAALVLVLIASALAQLPEQTPTPPTDPKIVFKVSLIERRNEFRMGEIIPIKLSFSSRIKNGYEIDEAQYDRSGRMESERFIVTPVDGAVDPLADYERGMSGGLRGFSFLKQEPWTIPLNLNEWIRFTKPGEYKVKVASSRVQKVDSSSA